MSGRALLAAALVVSVLGACAGGESATEDDVSGVRPKTTPSPERARANQAEVDWAGRVIEWAIGFSVPVERIGSVADAIATAKQIPNDFAAAIEHELDTIINCAPALQSKVGKAPSPRLEPVARTLEGACQRFAHGADVVFEIVNGEPDKFKDLLVDEWKDNWEAGGDLFRSAAEELVDFQPANARELTVAEGSTDESRVEPRFSEVASSLADTDIEARCWSSADWAELIAEMEKFTAGRITSDAVGFAGFGDYRVNIGPDACAGLVQLTYEEARPTGRLAQLRIALGVGTLAHEAEHARGVFDEVLAECLGMQHLRSAARKLGADARYAAALARAYWLELYPGLPRSYRSPECREGGRLDAHPRSSVWP